jgi:hypothetical protein
MPLASVIKRLGKKALDEILDKAGSGAPPVGQHQHHHAAPVVAVPPTPGAQPGKHFVHPGTLMGPRELELMCRRVAAGEQPWKKAFEQLKADTPMPYHHHALKVGMPIGWQGVRDAGPCCERLGRRPTG